MMGMGYGLLPRFSGSPFSKTSKSEGSSRLFTKDKAEAKDSGYSLGIWVGFSEEMARDTLSTALTAGGMFILLSCLLFFFSSGSPEISDAADIDFF